MDNSDFLLLLVDDEPKNIQLLGSILSEAGYGIAFATSAEGAIEALRNNSIDLVLLDIMMPETSGFELCQKIKANEDTKDLPIIFISANSDRENIVHGFEMGGQDYISKPFNHQELLKRVETQLQLVAQRKSLDQLNKNLEAQVRKRTGELNNEVLRNKELKVKFETIFRKSPIGIVILNRETMGVVDCNQRFLDIFGFSDYMVENGDFVLENMFEDRELFHKIIRHFDPLITDIEMLSLTGEIRHIHLNAEPVELADINAYIMLLQDTTTECTLKLENEVLELTSRIDVLTQISNRRDLEEKLSNQIYRFERNQKSFVVIIGDIDNFKRVNDTYGHDAGDLVLRKVAEVLSESLRKQDMVGRWGGEEFLAILPDTNIHGGQRVAEKLRQCLSATEYIYKNNRLEITMTFGLAVYEKQGQTVDEVVKQADTALYCGKRRGKNCVMIPDLYNTKGVEK
ncbi:MAG: diguanylate cyclase [Candidatus Cloacimonetes bacterium]|nr:diguanylate cyclase [Candidatus Cloacimonadota bacterium]